MGLLQLLVAFSAVLALTGVVPAIRRRRWHAFWPAPIMAFGLVVGLRDLVALMGGRSVGLPTPSLVLGVWAAVVVLLAGTMEIVVCWREELPERAFVVPALLIAGGVALAAPLLAARQGGSLQLTGVLSGLLIIAAGTLLAVGRLWPIHQKFVRYAWPVALGLGAVSGIVPARPHPDPFAEAKAEIASLETAWHQRGFRVARTDTAAPGWGIALMVRYRVEASDVYVYLIAHDTISTPDGHLEPRLVIPRPSHGVPHVHRSLHLLVVCITEDWRFARQLDELVRALARTEPLSGHSAVARAPSMSRLGPSGRPARRLALFHATLQLTVPIAASWADARIEAEARVAAPGAHVESHPTNNCARLHAADCALCRFLSTPSRGSSVISPQLNPGSPIVLALPDSGGPCGVVPPRSSRHGPLRPAGADDPRATRAGAGSDLVVVCRRCDAPAGAWAPEAIAHRGWDCSDRSSAPRSAIRSSWIS